MDNNINENVTPEATKEEVVNEVKTEETKQEVTTDITGQPIVDDNSYVKTPEQIKSERKEKLKKFIFGDKTKKKEPMDKRDVLCYIGAFLCFLLAALPFLLRTYDPMYDPEAFFDKGDEEETEVKVKYKKLYCNKSINQTGFSYNIITEGVYGNNVIEQLTITYNVSIKDPTLTFDMVEIPEYIEFSAIKSDAITENVEAPSYKVKIDFKNKSIDEFKKELPVSDHTSVLPSQREKYTNEGFSCIIENMGEENANN